MADDEQVHHPDIKIDPDNRNGLMCWLNMDRHCGADCMAYANPPLAKGPDKEANQLPL